MLFFVVVVVVVSEKIYESLSTGRATMLSEKIRKTFKSRPQLSLLQTG